MRKLIHLGYPKTATTSLQKNIFEKLSPIHYKGKYIQTGVLSKKSSLLNNWHIGEIYNFDDDISNPFLVSEEKLLASSIIPRPVGLFRAKKIIPLIDVLTSIYNSFANPHEIDFILTIRPQNQLIHSFYSQIYSRVSNIEFFFKSLDSYVDYILNNPFSSQASFYDFQHTCQIIYSVFPSATVHILPCETYINDTSTITSLLSTYDLVFDITPPSKLTWSNNRSLSSQAKTAANASFLPLPYYLSYRLLFSRYLRSYKFLEFLRLSLQDMMHSCSPSFTLNPSQSSAIIEAYRDSNRQLSSMYNLDLDNAYYKV